VQSSQTHRSENIGSKQNPTLNPYRFAAFEIWNRLRWDLQIESWHSRSKVRAWKDRYLGQKAVIVCNGPSLLHSNLSRLKGIFSFGLNKINLLFDKTSFRPACIVAVNPFVVEQNAEFYNCTEIPLFLDSCGLQRVRARKNIAFLHSSSQNKFAQDCSISVYQGYTVTFVAMQLAFHMGFKDVALIGCDHNFSTKGPANKTVVSGQKDDNHFDPNYFAGGVKWQLPDLPNSEAAYSLAQLAFQSDNRSLVNCTVGGCLELLPRIELEKFVE
jgi:hypothetical protein